MENNESDTKIERRIKDYIEHLFINPKFLKSVKHIRRSIKIPENGVDILLFDELVIADIHPRIPEIILGKKYFSLLLENLLIKFGLNNSWTDFFSDYVLFNFIGIIDVKKDFFLLNLGHKNKKYLKEKEIFDKSTLYSPIVLLIPPLASQREITSFIITNWERIEKIQQSYGKKLSNKGQIRTKNSRVARRNQFIYQNKKLPKKELISAIADEFGDIMDYTYISKIIKMEIGKKSVGI